MSTHEQLEQLQEMLASKNIRERKTGIAMANGMLAQGLHREQIHAWLTQVAKNDLIKSVQQAAQAALDADPASQSSRLIAPPDYIFDARCPNGHVHYYDKREVCRRQGKVSRGHEEEKDEVILRCKTQACAQEFSVAVSCEGYK